MGIEMNVAETIKTKLTAKLEPARLEIIDESHLHAGHAGAREGGESHFRVNIVAEIFSDLNRVARQRMIYEILAEELEGPIHALALSTKTPAEA
jgi:BolA family transcriptional regulator, general stress-responsive regulator